MLRQELETLNGLDMVPDGSWVGFAEEDFMVPVLGDGISSPFVSGGYGDSRL